VVDASAKGKRKINYVEFAKSWNQTADGKTHTWDKTNNVRASQELIEAKTDLVTQTRELFQAHTAPFPDSLIGFASSSHPQRGVIEFTDLGDYALPSSITVDLAISRPRITPNLLTETQRPYPRINYQRSSRRASESAVAQNFDRPLQVVRTGGDKAHPTSTQVIPHRLPPDSGQTE
jgi:hypothetical protein